MATALGRLALAALQYAVATQVAPRVLQGRRGLKKLAVGMMLLVASSVLGSVGVVVLLAALFLQLADLPQFVTPALIAGGVSLLLGILAFVEMIRAWRR